MTEPRTVLVPRERVARWFDNFAQRHGPLDLAVQDGALAAVAVDQTCAIARLPFDRVYDGPVDPDALAAQATAPDRWGLLLVRKGGFAVALVEGERVVDSKVGQRHVQGRTKAGGQSQQRFARRRDNQARAAYAAAGEHAVRILTPPLDALVCGGDRHAVEAVLADPRLGHLTPAGRWLAVPDPRRSVLEQAALDACSLAVTINEP